MVSPLPCKHRDVSPVRSGYNTARFIGVILAVHILQTSHDIILPTLPVLRSSHDWGSTLRDSKRRSWQHVAPLSHTLRNNYYPHKTTPQGPRSKRSRQGSTHSRSLHHDWMSPTVVTLVLKPTVTEQRAASGKFSIADPRILLLPKFPDIRRRFTFRRLHLLIPLAVNCNAYVTERLYLAA